MGHLMGGSRVLGPRIQCGKDRVELSPEDVCNWAEEEGGLGR